MTQTQTPISLKLDPWSASSLLQKAIRRSEVELAKAAAWTLYRQRGNAIWRRLITIAFEDIGIGAPELVSEMTWLATDKQLRAAVGEDLAIVLDLTQRLAEAPKDRSADYLFCAGLKLPASRHERVTLARHGPRLSLSVATDPHETLLRRSVAVLLSCSVDGLGLETMPKGVFNEIAIEINRQSPSPLHHAATLAASKQCHPIVLMAPLLWSAHIHSSSSSDVSMIKVPKSEYVGPVPLYTYDMHTWVGKHAITRLANENRDVRDVLARYAPPEMAAQVAHVAAFYADGSPVRRRFQWSQSFGLELMGRQADLIHEGCVEEGVGPILECFGRNLGHLNALRKEILGRRASQ